MRQQKVARFGLELYNELVERVGTENNLSQQAKVTLMRDVQQAIIRGKLPTRDPDTTARIADPSKATPYVTVTDFNAWLDTSGSMLVRLSTLMSGPRDPAALSSKWEGRTARDFIEEKKRHGSYTNAAKAYGVSRQAYTSAYKRAVEGSVKFKKSPPQGLAQWTQGLAQNGKYRRNSNG